MEVPDGATHYDGFLPDEATFYRLAPVSDDRPVERAWSFWAPSRKEWMFAGYNRPRHLKEIEYARS